MGVNRTMNVYSSASVRFPLLREIHEVVADVNIPSVNGTVGKGQGRTAGA